MGELRLTYVQPHKSIRGEVTEEEIADFVVLSGPNGAGKSNLLEAIQQGAVTIDGFGGQPPQGVRLFGVTQLAIAAEGPQNIGAYGNRWVQLEEVVKNAVSEFTQRIAAPLEPGSNELEAAVQTRVQQSRILSTRALERMLDESGKRLIEFDIDDYRRHVPLMMGVRDLFAITLNELFLTYHHRRGRNDYLQWLEAKGRGAQGALSDENFSAKYGPPPWELLNEILTSVGLEYHFEAPRGSEDELTYEPLLIHNADVRTTIRTSDLSSGEKTLLAVALTLYTGLKLGEAIELPRVLLLDEPDAVLHPSMAQNLLGMVDRTLCQQYGLKVILVTHAPSTVALAPEESLYTMRRIGVPRVQYVSRDAALAALLVGLPTLSVRQENRRTVFVESDHDEGCYQELFRLLRHHFNTPLSLEFIASGRGGQGNAEAVKHLVAKLRGAGNSVQGIVDRDARAGAPEGIDFVPTRRALENLVLDPVAVGLLLLREGVIASEDAIGVPLRHFEIQDDHVQALADHVATAIRRENDDDTGVTVRYIGGASVAVPQFYLALDGHRLEDRLMRRFPPLNQFHRTLKMRVIQRALADVPAFIPQDVADLFQRLLK
jgi:ABC-type branched-subunit amino acid transport system ATPase component